MPLEAERGIDSPGGRIIDVRELPDVDAGN